MDRGAPFDDPEWSATSAVPDPLERRLAAIEDRLTTLEGSLRSEIALDLEAVSQEMRRAVSELGRLLLRDLDRLTRLLGEHRDAIVDRLLAEVSTDVPAEVSAADPPPAAPAGVADAAPRDESVPIPIETPALRGEDGRWRVPRRGRRRSPKPAPGDDTGGE